MKPRIRLVEAIMWEFEAEVSEVIRETPHIKSFRFPVPASGAPYEAGQFFFVTIRVSGQDAVHHFSLSSSPTDAGYIQFTKRITSSDYSRALDNMKPGDRALLRGPYGKFTLPESPRPLAFLSGGIGITPLRSMLRFIAAKNLPFDVVLLYGNAAWEDIAFRDELDSLPKTRRDIRVAFVLSGPEFPPAWNGPRGHIDKDLITSLIPDFAGRFCYISGPPRMVMSLAEQLAALNMPPDQLKKDSFTGYD